MSIEVSFIAEWGEWIQVMENAVRNAPRQTRKVVGQGSNNIKKEWKVRWTGYAHLPHLKYSITYDVDETADTFITSVIGPQRGAGARAGMQWELGSFIEFGTLTSGPIPGGIPALELEGPRFVQAIAEMGIDLLSTSLGGATVRSVQR